MDNVINAVELFSHRRLMNDCKRINAEAGAQAKVDAFVDALFAEHNPPAHLSNQ